METLTDRVAAVTGAARGIGRAVALELVERGCRVAISDIDEDAAVLAERNLNRNGLDGTCEQADVNPYLYRHHYDVVDLDPFGTVAPFLDAAFDGTAELLCLTATDTAPLCGAHFESGVRKYGTVPRNTEFHPEMGVRVLLSACVNTGVAATS